MVIAAFFALLVPDNGAQAVNAAEALRLGGESTTQTLPAIPSARSIEFDRRSPVDSDAAMLLALGFVGAVMARRLRAD